MADLIKPNNLKSNQHDRSSSGINDWDNKTAVLKQKVELLQSELDDIKERDTIRTTINDKMVKAFRGNRITYLILGSLT